MFQYHHHAGAFVALDDATNAVIDQVRGQFEKALWTAGHSDDPSGPSAQLKKVLNEKGMLFPSFTGKVTSVKYHVNSHDGNDYEKCRVDIRQESGETVTLSLDLGSEFTQRLIQKLDALGENPDRIVTIAGFPEMVERNGRFFCNHVCTVKEVVDGKKGDEVKLIANHSRLCQDRMNEAGKQMADLGLDYKAINQNKAKLRQKYHAELLRNVVQAKFKGLAVATPSSSDLDDKLP